MDAVDGDTLKRDGNLYMWKDGAWRFLATAGDTTDEQVTFTKVDAPEYLRDPEPVGPLTEDGDVPPLYKKWDETARVVPASDFHWKVDDLFTEAMVLLLNKHKNYGPTNISRAPGGALNGLRVRMHDKIARLNHMIDSGVEDKVGEALEETLMDLANYALIGVLVLRGEWPDA